MTAKSSVVSYWEKSTFLAQCDVAIVGSGIVGLCTAIFLKKADPSLKITILERGSMPSGASTKNAGFACFGSLSEILSDVSTNGEEEILALMEQRWKGLLALRQLVADEDMKFEQNGGYELFTKEDEALYEQCVGKIDHYNKALQTIVGKRVYQVADDAIQRFGFHRVNHLIKNNYEAQIDTGKMMRGLLKKAHLLDINLINGIAVTSFEEHGASVALQTSIGQEIACKYMMIATNGFAKQLLPELDVLPARAQVLITKPIDNLKPIGTFFYDRGFYYFRNIGNRILFGGGRNLDIAGETTTALSTTEVIQNRLEYLLKTTVIPDNDFEIDHRWSGIMGVGKEKKPVVKSISNRVGCAVRLSGMGVALGSLLGEQAAHLSLSSLQNR